MASSGSRGWGGRPDDAGRPDGSGRPRHDGRRDPYDRVRAKVDDGRIQVLSSACTNYDALKAAYSVCNLVTSSIFMYSC